MKGSTAGVFYGWVIVAAAFVALGVVFGIIYAFAAFFPALQAEFGATRAETSLVFSLSTFVFSVVGALSGTIADRFGARRIVLIGMLIVAATLMLVGRGHALWQIYIGYGVGVGIGVGFVYVPLLGVVQRWFSRRRGLASGIAVTGVGVGTLVVPLLATALVAAFGWRDAYLWLALLPLTAGVLAAIVLVNGPELRDAHPDGDDRSIPSDQPLTPAEDFQMTLRDALRTRMFYLLYLATVLNSAVVLIPFVHLAPYASDNGVPENLSVLLIGMIGIGSIVGRFVMAGMADRLGRKLSFTLMLSGLSMISMLWLVATSIGPLSLFAILFGVFYGGIVALMPALTADYFGGRYAGSIIGLLYTNIGVGALLGPPLAGYAFDLFQSYTLPIAASIVFNSLAAFVVFLLPEPKIWRSKQDAWRAR